MRKVKKLVLVEGLHKTKHPLYTTYKGMLARCYNPNHKHYSYYGGRGVRVSALWRGRRGFQHFVQDMGPRPEGFTLERINNSRGYSKSNCKWESMTTQALNKRLATVNTSGYVGVHWFKAANMWTAYIDYKRKRKNLGYFHNLHDAIEARRIAELERQETINK